MMVFPQSKLTSITSTACIATLLLMAGCASAPPIDQVDLMPAPDVYGDGLINPLPESYPIEGIPYKGMLYATDRQPATEKDPEQYYLNERGQLLRLGVAKVALASASEFEGLALGLSHKIWQKIILAEKLEHP